MLQFSILRAARKSRVVFLSIQIGRPDGKNATCCCCLPPPHYMKLLSGRVTRARTRASLQKSIMRFFLHKFKSSPASPSWYGSSSVLIWRNFPIHLMIHKRKNQPSLIMVIHNENFSRFYHKIWQKIEEPPRPLQKIAFVLTKDGQFFTLH